MNSLTHSKSTKTKHNSKVKRHWEYDPETGDEQETFAPLVEEEKEINKNQYIGDLFSYDTPTEPV